ncbi:MAG: tripartite tricarboxylate transporter substrate binding protein [Xanthobacteraceae bacterium]|nr:tripartite tricarboxylate transporter substrate binding protein [Xanthobacteraceae bacterium]
MTLLRSGHRALGRAGGLWLAAAAALAPLAAQTAQAQVPKTIRIVVPFPAGGPTDTTARVVSEYIGKLTGTSFVVENRPGGGSAIASEAVARAAPDGGTLLIVAGALLINPILKKLSYDPLTSFEPICKMVRVPHFIVVNKHSPLKNFGDFIAAAKAKPGELTFATVGPATGPHIAFEVLKRRANVDIRFVPYPGTTPSINAVLGGHVAVAMGDFRDVIGQLQSGTLRGLATTAPKRIEQLPDIPTVAELGYPGYEAESWFGLVAPAGTPRETMSQLIAWVSAAMRDSEVRTKLANTGLFPTGVCGAEFGAHLKQQYEEVGRAIREANIQAN